MDLDELAFLDVCRRGGSLHQVCGSQTPWYPYLSWAATKMLQEVRRVARGLLTVQPAITGAAGSALDTPMAHYFRIQQFYTPDLVSDYEVDDLADVIFRLLLCWMADRVFNATPDHVDSDAPGLAELAPEADRVRMSCPEAVDKVFSSIHCFAWTRDVEYSSSSIRGKALSLTPGRNRFSISKVVGAAAKEGWKPIPAAEMKQDQMKFPDIPIMEAAKPKKVPSYEAAKPEKAPRPQAVIPERFIDFQAAKPEKVPSPEAIKPERTRSFEAVVPAKIPHKEPYKPEKSPIVEEVRDETIPFEELPPASPPKGEHVKVSITSYVHAKGTCTQVGIKGPRRDRPAMTRVESFKTGDLQALNVRVQPPNSKHSHEKSGHGFSASIYQKPAGHKTSREMGGPLVSFKVNPNEKFIQVDDNCLLLRKQQPFSRSVNTNDSRKAFSSDLEVSLAPDMTSDGKLTSGIESQFVGSETARFLHDAIPSPTNLEASTSQSSPAASTANSEAKMEEMGEGEMVERSKVTGRRLSSSRDRRLTEKSSSKERTIRVVYW